jgi:single-strand DNA-binding protein
MAATASITGHLGRDPELMTTDNGQMVTKFTIAAKQAKVQGQDPPPLWFTVEVWGQSAAWIADNLRKGEMAYVTGELRIDQWTDRTTGEVKQAMCLKQARVEKLWAPREQGAAPGAPAAAPAAPAAPPAAGYPPAGYAQPAPAPAPAPAAAPPAAPAAAPAAAPGYDPFSSAPPY